MPRHIGDLQLAKVRSDRPAALLPIVVQGPLGQPPIGHPPRRVLIEEPVQPVIDGRRSSRNLPAPERVGLASADRGQLRTGPFARFGEVQLPDAGEDRLPALAVRVVADHEILCPAPRDLEPETGHLGIPNGAGFCRSIWRLG